MMPIIWSGLAILFALLVYEIGTPWQLCSIPFILLCIWRGRKQTLILNPYYLIIPMFVSYALYTHEMGIGLLTELNNHGNILIILCFSALFLGFATVEAITFNPVIVNKYNENFNVILTLGLLPTLLSLVLIGNPLAMDGQDALEAKSNFSLPIIGQLAFFLQASIIVACKNNKKNQVITAILLCAFFAVITLTKTAMLMTAIFIIAGFIRFRPNLKNSKVFTFVKRYAYILLPVILIGGFIFNNAFRKEASGNKESYLRRERPAYIDSRSDFAEGMYLNYLYFCSPWGNLQYNLNFNHREGHGNNTFAQFGKKVGITMVPAEKKQPAYLNTHSFITDFYLDFGYFGSVIATYILGCIIFFCYKKFGLSTDALLLSFYCLVAYATVMLFFSNHFIIGYLLNYFITFGGYYLVMHKLKIR